ncbi:MAG: hypothetical protein AAGJ87_08225 [Pseudomonadota bacterium]
MNKITSFAAAAVVSLFSAASAEDASVSGDIGAKDALIAAIDKAVGHGDQRWAFTMRRTQYEKDRADTYTLRFDPRRPPKERWSLLEPTEDSLSSDEKKEFKNIRKNAVNADGQLVYDKLSVDIDTAQIRSEDADRAELLVRSLDDSIPQKMRDAVDMVLTVNKPARYVETVALRAREPFKPAPVAKLETFMQIQHYAPLDDGGPAILRKSEAEASGKAMFRAFNSKSLTEYFDFEAVPAAEVAAVDQ